jgi:hypothetical protein
MKSTTEIKYKYACDSKNQVVYIGDLEKTDAIKQEVFTCISCENLLIPKLGKIRQKHFAHKYVQNCSGETYLHRLAKLVFVQEYQSCLDRKEPFYIELAIERECNAYEKHFGKLCRLESLDKKFDLTKRYVKIDLEKKDGDFIPDILLSNESGTKKIFVEIAVAHRITDKKAQSLVEIIEIRIKNEEDILWIRQRSIRQRDPKIKLVNFEIKPEQGNLCNGRNCPENMGLFQVYQNGKSILTWQSLPKTYSLLERRESNFLYYKVVSSDKEYARSDEYIKNVIDAYNGKIAIRNCFLCRYHGDNWSYYDEDRPIFCKFLKIKCNSNQASACQYYRPDSKYFPKEINTIREKENLEEEIPEEAIPEKKNTYIGQDSPRDTSEITPFFLVLESGSSYLLNVVSFNSLVEKFGHKILYYKTVDFEESSSWRNEYKKNVINAYNGNISVKSCFLCRHHREYKSRENKYISISCGFLGIKCNANEALECEHYEPVPRYLPGQS